MHPTGRHLNCGVHIYSQEKGLFKESSLESGILCGIFILFTFLSTHFLMCTYTSEMHVPAFRRNAPFQSSSPRNNYAESHVVGVNPCGGLLIRYFCPSLRRAAFLILIMVTLDCPHWKKFTARWTNNVRNPSRFLQIQLFDSSRGLTFLHTNYLQPRYVTMLQCTKMRTIGFMKIVDCPCNTIKMCLNARKCCDWILFSDTHRVTVLSIHRQIFYLVCNERFNFLGKKSQKLFFSPVTMKWRGWNYYWNFRIRFAF